MAYVNLIPQPNDQLAVSQGQLLGNTVALSAVGGNTTAGSAALNINAGYNFINFAPQAVFPVPAANRIYIYNKVEPISAINQLYIGNPANTPGGTNVPFTAGANSATEGWTYLPSGYLLKWGVKSGTGNQTVIFTGPAYTIVPLMIQLTPQVIDSAPFVVSRLNTQFVYNNTGANSVYWFVLGY